MGRSGAGGAGGRGRVLVRGAGDLATGVAHRLYRAGFDVVLTELPEPKAVRRLVAFSECVFEGEREVEGVRAVRVDSAAAAAKVLGVTRPAGPARASIPVVVDRDGRALDAIREILAPPVLVDARMAKRNLGTTLADAPVVIGLGPGFEAGIDCGAVVETARGPDLGRVIYHGRALESTGVPGEVGGYTVERLLLALGEGRLRTLVVLGARVAAGQVVAEVVPEADRAAGTAALASPDSGLGRARAAMPVRAAIPGIVRGLLRDGAPVRKGQKVGDIDPRFDTAAIRAISDKARAVAGGVLEALLCLSSGRPPDGGDSAGPGAESATGPSAGRAAEPGAGGPASPGGTS